MNDSPGIAGVDHTGFVVSSLPEAIRFWTEALGFTLERQSKMGGEFLRQVTGVAGAEVRTAIVRAPDGYAVELLHYSNEPLNGRVTANASVTGAAHLAIRVRDLTAAVRRVQAAGWQPAGTPQIIPTGPKQGMWVVYVSGPDHITIELMQPSPAHE